MAIGTPVAIGTVQNKTSESSTVLTTTAAVPAGALIVVGMAGDGSDFLSVTDSASNTYQTDVNLASNAGNVKAQVVYVKNATALASSSAITVNWATNETAKAITAFYVEGVDTTAPLDQEGSATGTSGTPSVSTAGATSQADEITIGVLGTEGPSGDSFTQDASPAYSTPPTRVGTSGGGAASNITVAGGYFIETATGTKTYNPTCTSRDWAMVIVTFKGGSSNATGTIAQNLPKLSQSAAGGQKFQGSIAQTLPKLSQNVVGGGSSLASGTIAQSLPKLQQLIAGSEIIAGSSSQQLPRLTQQVDGTVIQNIDAVVDQTLPKLTQNASGIERFSGNIVQTLPKLSQSVAGLERFVATSASQLPKLQQSAIGVEAIKGTAVQLLPKLSQNAVGGVTETSVTGTVAQILPKLQQEVIGQGAGLGLGDGFLRRRRRGN